MEIQLQDRTLGQWMEHWAETTPDKEYLVYSDRDLRFTWKEFNERVDRMAKGMLSIGIKHGTHVGIWATNVPDWLTFLYAAAKIGAVAVTVNTNYKQSELEFLVENADIHTLCITDGVFDGSYVDMVYTMLPELKESQRGYLKSKRFPVLKNVVYIGQEKYRGMYNTPELLLLGENVSDETLVEAKKLVTPHDVVNMQYTSGTTGFPKGVMLTHYNIANNGLLTGEHMKFTADDKLCCCVPLFHCFGVVLASMNVLTHGCTQVMVEKFDPLVVLASIHKERCTALYGVPTMFIAELNHPMFSMFDLTSLRTGIMAGSLCPVELMKQVEEKMYMKVTSVYGLTEAAPGMTATRIDDPFDVRCNTVGRDFEHTEVKVIDPETGEECPTGVQGEMCNRGYNTMKGYYKNPEATAEVIDGCKRRRRQLPHHRTHQGYDYTRRGEYLSARNRRVPLSVGRRKRRASSRYSLQKVRRGGRRIHHPARRSRPARVGCTRLLHWENLPVQDSQIHILRKRIPHDRERQDTEVQAERPGTATLQGTGN